MSEHVQPPADGESRPGSAEDGSVVKNPGELVRLATMLQALLFEVHDITLDEAGRRRLFAIHHRAVDAIKRLVSSDLEFELTHLGLPIEDVGASASELRIAQAQIVGWLHGLFQGIQAATFARQLLSVDQLQQMQRELTQSSQTKPESPYL